MRVVTEGARRDGVGFAPGTHKRPGQKPYRVEYLAESQLVRTARLALGVIRPTVADAE
jgi:hypothetical protein